MPTSIYDLHSAAFANVSAYVILDAKGERVATVAFKYPHDGAGRLYCYLHVLGTPMVRGHAGGFGYAKHDAAIAKAARKLVLAKPETEAPVAEFQAALTDSGHSWETELRNAGFTVLQAV